MLNYEEGIWNMLFILIKSLDYLNRTQEERKRIRIAIPCLLKSLSIIFPKLFNPEKVTKYLTNYSPIQFLDKCENSLNREMLLKYLVHIEKKTVEKYREMSTVEIWQELNKKGSTLYMPYQEQLFNIWLYNLYVELNPQHPKNLEELKQMYNEDLITKKDWGNTVWAFIHSLPLVMDDTLGDKGVLVDLFMCLQVLLPGPVCREHLYENFKELQIFDYIDINKDSKLNRMLFFEWTVNLHNRVNASLNKPYVNTPKAYSIWDEYIKVPKSGTLLTSS